MKKNMKIPKSFKLFGSTITVEFDNDKCDQDESYGLVKFKSNKMFLSDFAQGFKIDLNEIESSYYHEMLHFILNRLGYDDLNDDEKFVKQVSKALQQCLTTQEY